MTNSHHTTPLCGNNPSYITTAQISRSQPPSVIGQNVFVLMRQLHICHLISQPLLPIQQEMSYVCPSDEICNPNGLLHMVAGCPSTHHHTSVARLARPMIPTFLPTDDVADCCCGPQEAGANERVNPSYLSTINIMHRFTFSLLASANINTQWG